MFSVTEHYHILASNFLSSIAQPNRIAHLDTAFVAAILCWIGLLPDVLSQLSRAELVLTMASIILTNGGYGLVRRSWLSFYQPFK